MADNERYIRIQLSKDKKQVQFVLLYVTPEGEKKKVYFALPRDAVKYYILGTSNQFYLVAREMFGRDDPKYKAYLNQKKLKRDVAKIESSDAPLMQRTGGKI